MTESVHHPALCKQVPDASTNGIYVYEREDYNPWFEAEYSGSAEPWNYSLRGGELYRHQHTAALIQRYKPTVPNLLELGSSKGLMTERLIPFCKSIYASDISVSAMNACKQRCDEKAAAHHCHLEYFVTTTPGLPFADNSFDVVTVCDGLIGWWFSEEKKVQALDDVYRILKKDGIAILTDFIMPQHNIQQFDDYEKLVRNSPFSVEEISYIYDRLWYQLESFSKKTGLAKGLKASTGFAQKLHGIGKIFGRKMSSHIVVVLRKK